MLEFAMNNINTYVRGDGSTEDNEMIANLSHCLSYIPKGQHFFKGDLRNKVFSFLYQAKDYTMFPTGLVRFVLDNKHKRKIKLNDGTYGDTYEYYTIQASVRDNRKRPDVNYFLISLWNDKTNSPLILHDFQMEAIRAFNAHERGIIRISTGGGKSVLAIALTQIYGLKTLFIVHTKDLVKQTIREYKNKANIDCGIIGDGEWNPKEVTVSTVQTLSRRLKESYCREYLERVEFAIWDETQHASKTYQKVHRALKNAYYRVGFSATVGMGQKEEKLRSMALSGPMIYDVKMERLVNNEQLAKPTVIFIRIPKMDNDPDWEWMDFSEQYDQGIINNEFRNMILAHAIIQMRVRGYSSLALIEKLDQGRNIAALLEGHSLNIQYISGKDKAETRDEAKTNLQSRELDVLVTSRIFNEGVDLPDLECVVVASGYKAAGLTLQRYGRAVRKTKQKSTTTIIDCYDEFAPKLLAHSEARLKMVQKNKAFDVMVIEWQDLEKALDELMEKRRKA